MPFNINNVDITVAANAVYGITMTALTDLVDDPAALIDADVEVCWYFCHLSMNIMWTLSSAAVIYPKMSLILHDYVQNR